MSLKAFHVVFIAISILLAFGFAAWSCHRFSMGGALLDLVFGVMSALSGIALVVYGRYVLRKLKHISYL